MKPKRLLAFAFAYLFLACGIAEAQKKPNILVIMGDDIGWYNTSIYNRGDMGYQTPNIDRIGKEGAMFLTWYAQQSCTAGRAAFVTGQSPIRTGLTKVGLPGADVGLGPLDPSVADVMKSLGYATGQAKWLDTFKEHPIRQRPASFNLDEVMKKLSPTN